MACCVEQTFHSTCSVELEHVEATPGAGWDRHSLSTTYAASATHSTSQPLPNRSCMDQTMRAGGSTGMNSR
jgi:hypothetical protein